VEELDICGKVELFFFSISLWLLTFEF
jgi:hypothetical protein